MTFPLFKLRQFPKWLTMKKLALVYATCNINNRLSSIITIDINAVQKKIKQQDHPKSKALKPHVQDQEAWMEEIKEIGSLCTK